MIPNLQYLLTNPEIQEELISMLLRFSEQDNTEVQIRADEANLMLFKLKQDANNLNREERKKAEAERLKIFHEREAVLQEVAKVNETLIEERVKKEEESK